MIYRLLSAIAMWSAMWLPASAFELPAKSTQCLIGIADTWDSSTATLTLYQKVNGHWQAAGVPWEARLGKKGLVWGLGIHPLPAGAATKKEGDWRSPAGVFSIVDVWGYEPSIKKNPDLSYHQVSSRDLWIEDPTSPKYNQHVILDHEPNTPWEKKQQMKQADPAHALQVFIAHNASPKVIPNAGSSIFFHVWRGGGSKPTSGCTTMDEPKLRAFIAKLDPKQHPLYVLLPKAEYEKYRSPWKLP